ncbi:Detected protein of confused Function [Hibiscus syriacus]|uniref:Detected protein of confused Function n=1 Tax=Hibiscus syriacus TaxID=106335 RepID=A0A6A3A9E6_HIBSY|nr:Detected protein of confused Function [Hibiscus syriacus]
MPGVSSDSGRGALVPICTDSQGSAVYPLRHCLKSPISRLSVSWSRGHYLRVSVFAAPSSVEDDAGGKIVEVKLSGGDGEVSVAHWWRVAYGSSQRTMERDFLGLNSEEPWVMVKEEVNTYGYKQIGDKAKKVGYDPKESPMFMPTSTMNATELQAQAIMFLAGSSSAYPKPQAQTHILKPVQVESVPANQIINTQLNSGASNPHVVAAQSGSGSTSTEDQMICKTSGTRTPSTPISKFEPPKLLNTMGYVAATGMMPSIPQARKASLAQFFEKHKERVMNAASPYNFIKKSIDYATTLESSA